MMLSTTTRRLTSSTTLLPTSGKGTIMVLSLQCRLRILHIYFFLNIVGAFPSSLLYLLLPAGTIEYFGGTVTPTSLFWVTTAASADITAGVIALLSLRSDSLPVKQVGLFALLAYSMSHFSQFLRAHYFVEPHPSSVVAFEWSGILVPLMVFGFCRDVVAGSSEDQATSGKNEDSACFNEKSE